ncbi:hypothetical protein C1I98_13340 [Spongiactinospora gelatinilytica]|uniref:Bacteriophage T5 Orf172 DNA-binding domain-containing protein n=1 Tax=Spongiactinospora gelatinilytica TaxID=2666298 RepID=A0A2W2HB89_9ACTN|nr:GIY-YIG nuclease family protein [Spongiactinospora gelatinilytica]PZG47450.1 hypothetical protein C1I98_13340 [Spongiactinospora gelatinilytica]
MRSWAEPTAPVPLCWEHLVFVRIWVNDQFNDLLNKPFAPRSRPMKQYVYFIRRGDLIKIGWTSDMATRMRFHKPDAILHSEQGDQKDEAKLHRKFAHLRVPAVDGRPAREWFRPGDDLIAYIEERKRLTA